MKESCHNVSNDDLYFTLEDSPLNIPAPGILENDIDIENATLVAEKFLIQLMDH